MNVLFTPAVNAKSTLMKYVISAFFALLLFVIASCVDKPILVGSGTYKGIIHEVNAGKRKILMEEIGGYLIELYFTDTTILIEKGETLPFSALNEGKKVEVKIKRKGDRIIPLSVKII